MKKIVIILCCCFAFLSTEAQKLSQEQIQQYLGDLQKQGILSEFGKDAFQKIMSRDVSNWFGNAQNNNPLATVPDTLLQSRTAILGFLGLMELMQNAGASSDELAQLQENTSRILGEKMLFHPAVEGELHPQNPLTAFSLELNIKAKRNNYLELADILQKIHLIHPKVHDDLKKWLQKDRIYLIKDFGFFMYAARQNYLYDNYDFLKNRQIQFLDSLKIVQLLSEKNYQKLLQSYKPYEIKSKTEILENCSNILPLPSNFDNFTREEIYKKIFNDIHQQLLPNFVFDHFNLTIKKDSPKQPNVLPQNPLQAVLFKLKQNTQPATLAFRADGQEYQQKADTDFQFFANLQSILPPDMPIDTSVIRAYSKVFLSFIGLTTKDVQAVNDFLADKKSKQRLFVLSNEFNPMVSNADNKKILMLLDSVQYALVSKFGRANLVNQRINIPLFNPFSGMNSRDFLSKIIQEYQNLGIISPKVSTSEKEKVILDLRREGNYFNVYRTVLQKLPNVTCKINSNPSGMDEVEKNDFFKNYVQKLSSISRENFLPIRVHDNFQKELKKSNKKEKTLKFGFELGNKKFEDSFVIPPPEMPTNARTNKNSVTMDENIATWNFPEAKFFSLINKSLQSQKNEGRFYVLQSPMEEITYLFLEKRQFDSLNKKHPEIFDESLLFKRNSSTIESAKDFKAEVFAKSLYRNQAFDEASFAKLKAMPDWKSAKEPSTVLKFLPNTFQLDMNDLKDKSSLEIYDFILHQAKEKILPKLQLSDLKITLDSTFSRTEEDTTRYLLALKMDGKLYEQYLYKDLKTAMAANVDSLKSPKSMYYPGISEFDFKVLNDYLNDSKDTRRLIVVDDYRSPMLSFVFQDSSQSKAIDKDLPNNFVDYSMYNSSFSRDSILAQINDYQQVKLFNKLDPATVEKAIAAYRRERNPSLLSLFSSIPNLTVTIPESFEQDKFKTFIQEISQLNPTKFHPEKVQDNFEKTLKQSLYKERTFVFRFSWGGKVYEDKLTQEALEKPKKHNTDDEEDEGYLATDFLPSNAQFLALVNRALSDNNSQELFYRSGESYFLLNRSQYNYLKNKHPKLFQKQKDNPHLNMDSIEDER